MNAAQIANLIISLLVGLGSGVLGSYLSLRVFQAKTEVKLDFFEREMTSFSTGLAEVNREIGGYREDVWTHDVEISRLCEKAQVPRVIRQGARR